MNYSQSINKTTMLIKPRDLNWQVHASKEVSYQVTFSYGLLDPDNRILANTIGSDGSKMVRRLVVIDKTVFDLYSEQLKIYFSAWNILPTWKIISAGESVKTMDQVYSIVDAMIDTGLLRRAEVVIAIGGGVLLDMVGFAASLYRRGVPYIRIPTTLMGQIDAGIGIKTGVNYGYHKNRLGTYFSPFAAFIEPAFLRTLDERHIANGVSEIIKIALIKDRALFLLLEQKVGELNAQTFSNYDLKIGEIFFRAIAGMLEELEPNLWEAVLERAVDYGHTFSPSLELQANPPLLHGEAVAIDMALSIALAHLRHLISDSEVYRALNLILKMGLPITHRDFTLDLVEKALDDSIKHRDGLQRVPLTNGIGDVIFVNDLTKNDLRMALEYLFQQDISKGIHFTVLGKHETRKYVNKQG